MARTSAQSLSSNFGKIAEAAGAELVGTDCFDQSIQLVLTGRADATINDSLSFLDFKKQKPDAPVKIAAEKAEADASGIIVRKGDPELVAAINQRWQTSRPTAPIRRSPTPISARTSRSNLYPPLEGEVGERHRSQRLCLSVGQKQSLLSNAAGALLVLPQKSFRFPSQDTPNAALPT